MKIQTALYRKDDIMRLHVSRKEGGRRFDNIQDSVYVLIRQFENNIKSHHKPNKRILGRKDLDMVQKRNHKRERGYLLIAI